LTSGNRSKDKSTFSWGVPVEDFPTGLWDDFDGTIEVCEYDDGDYGAQIHIVVRPAEYEYSPRGQEANPDSDEGLPQAWYGMGGDINTYDLSEDGLTVISGPIPQRNTNAAKFIIAAREFSNLKMADSSLKPISDLSFHWKLDVRTGTIKSTGHKFETVKLFPVGKSVGKAILGQTEGEKPSRRSGRRAAAQEESSNTDALGNQAQVEEQQEETTTRRSSRRAKAVAEESNTNDTSKSSDANIDIDGMVTDAVSLLVTIIGEAGETGLRRRQIAQKLLAKQENAGEELVTLAAERNTVSKAIEDGNIQEEDGVLYLPE
jgi:hypothetical protein